jgi:hypothetical protein
MVRRNDSINFLMFGVVRRLQHQIGLLCMAANGNAAEPTTPLMFSPPHRCPRVRDNAFIR